MPLSMQEMGECEVFILGLHLHCIVYVIQNSEALNNRF